MMLNAKMWTCLSGTLIDYVIQPYHHISGPSEYFISALDYIQDLPKMVEEQTSQMDLPDWQAGNVSGHFSNSPDILWKDY